MCHPALCCGFSSRISDLRRLFPQDALMTQRLSFRNTLLCKYYNMSYGIFSIFVHNKVYIKMVLQSIIPEGSKNHRNKDK